MTFASWWLAYKASFFTKRSRNVLSVCFFQFLFVVASKKAFISEKVLGMFCDHRYSIIISSVSLSCWNIEELLLSFFVLQIIILQKNRKSNCENRWKQKNISVNIVDSKKLVKKHKKCYSNHTELQRVVHNLIKEVGWNVNI